MGTLEDQRLYRLRVRNAPTKKYEKTPKGFLVRKYRNMLSRIVGVQKTKYHLYRNKYILPKEDFYKWALGGDAFWILYKVWISQNYSRKLTPTVDRIDPRRGYELPNMEWITHSENSRRGGKHKVKR